VPLWIGAHMPSFCNRLEPGIHGSPDGEFG
jgi:hypothetical protein